MPGFAGILSLHPAEKARRLADRMLQSMRHEPFYRSGFLSVPELEVHAGWAALEGTLAAGQPFVNEDRSVTLLMAGECFPEEGELERLRERNPAAADAPGGWLLARYEAQGIRFVESLNGLFSGLLIDRRHRRVLLFNDRYGAERLHVHERNGEIYFASEAKAILAVAPETRAFDDQGVAEFLAFGCTLAERSLFRGIRVLPGASRWTIEDGQPRKETYFSPEVWESQEPSSPDDFAAALQNLMNRVVPPQATAAPRIGISLTAGLDTRMIMASLPASADRHVCFTYSGEDVDPLDARISTRIAESCGLQHHVLRIGPDFFRDFASLAERTVYLTDGCFGPTGAHEIYMSRLAREIAPVRLTGNYGGEILRGVSTFKPQSPAGGLIAAEFLPAVRQAMDHPAIKGAHPVTFAAFRETPWCLFGNLQAGRSQIGFRTPYLDNDFVKLAYRRPASPREGTEACVKVVQRGRPGLAAIPTDMGWLGRGGWFAPRLRRLASKFAFKLDYLASAGLPSRLVAFEPAFQAAMKRMGLLGLHKHLRYAMWFRDRFARIASERLADPRIRKSPFWNARFVERLAEDHALGRRNRVNEINTVLTLQMVEDQLLRPPPGGDS